jgi:hypothetical protein
VLTPVTMEFTNPTLRDFLIDCLAGKVVQAVNVTSSTRCSGGDAVVLGSCRSLDRANANHSTIMGASLRSTTVAPITKLYAP